MPLKVYKRKDRKSYSIRGTVAGQRIEESAGTSDKALANEYRIKREQELQRDRIFGRTATATWAEAVNAYLDTGKQGRFLQPLLDHFGTTPLSKINQTAVETAARTLYPNASPATISRQVFTPVSAVLKVASKRDMCARPNLERPFVRKRKHKSYASQTWLSSFVSHASPRLGTLAIFMAFTGFRIGEALALEWDNVDLHRGEALVLHTKTGEPRRVALADIVVVALANLEGREGRVFGWEHRFSVYKLWKRCCAEAGIEYLRPHQAGRHTFASWMLADGHSLKVVADAGGWKSIELVADTYGHLERDHVDAAVRGMGRYRDVTLPSKAKSKA